MKEHYTAIVKQEDGWWIGWIQEIPGINCQEKTQAELRQSLREVLREMIEINREEAKAMAGTKYWEEDIAL